MNLPVILSLLGMFPLMAKSEASAHGRNVQYCSINHHHEIGSIGVVVDQSSRVGKEQKIGVEMAVHDFNRESHCSKVDLHIQDSQGNSARAASAVTEIVNKKQARVIIGSLTLQEAALLWVLDKVPKHIPIISTAQMSASLPLLPSDRSLPFIGMSTDINIQMQCIAAIVGHFRWRKVIAIYEHSNSFSADTGLVAHLSDSLRAIESVVEHHMAFHPVGSEPNPKEFIEEQLRKLKGKSVKVFTVLQSSLEFAMVLFEKAKELGMLDRGYVWIVSEDVASLLDSVKPSFILEYMQGIIALKTTYSETSHSFQAFERRFRRKYRSEYPEEEKFSSPSIYALRAYDSTLAVARALQNVKGKVNSSGLVDSILSCNFDGLAGKISFKNGALLQNPVYQVVNVIGKSYRPVALWSPEFGFSKAPIEHDGMVTNSGNGLREDLGQIYWPGAELKVPKGWTLGESGKPLRIGVPANGAFHYFVNVTFEQSRNETAITGFSIQVFEAAVSRLPYHLPHVLVPHYGSYDQLVSEVRNKNLDAAVGDIGIVVDRYRIADFTQPYLETGVVMVVTVKPDVTKTRLMVLKAFALKMWILLAALSVFTGAVIWLNEHANNNPEFRGPFPQNIGAMLWFSVTILSFAQRQSIRSNLSRLVLATWLFVTVVVTTCFTAAVTSWMTVPKIEPSIVDIDYLLGTDAPVGCNNNSYIGRFLTNVLHFKPENVRRIGSISDYPEAFQRGTIKAAFLAAPHAKVFLAKYCKGYTEAGPKFKLGGFGFVFQKGSPLADDLSGAILNITLTGTTDQMEKRMLSSLNCSSSAEEDNQGPSKIGTEPFFFLFLVSGSLLVVAFVNAVARLLERHCSIFDSIQASLINRRAVRWALLLLTRCFTKFGTRNLRVPIMHRDSRI
ncbi:glutamate receptor 2.7-like [Coffea arabica]|uniref:Glutamate receptor n=1 Tax=Coffea arabica TaxID=13443 RepID=A0ABM4VTG5_COFAR